MKDPNESDEQYQQYLESKAIETLSILYPSDMKELMDEWGGYYPDYNRAIIIHECVSGHNSSELPEVVNLYLNHPITERLFWEYIEISGQGG